MKNTLLGSWISTSALAVACLAGMIPSGRAQPVAPDTTAALPPNIAPGSPLAEVVKLVQSGMDTGVIKTYIANTPSLFNLNADQIIALSDAGVPTELVNAMLDHDKNLTGAATAAAAAVPPPVPAAVEDNSAPVAPTAEVDVNYFNDTLSPYGSWVQVEGYGRCWRPTTVIYDTSWQPYCDRGHWVYSDCGWYWDSDYSWGVTFHYGRWFHHDRFGWCWWPDTTWAPSWVTWRQSDAYCGWAPLPPFAEFRPGAGFFYRGANVGVGFDFGVAANFFTFVPVGNFCDRHPRSFRTDPRRGDEIFRQTTVINNYHDDYRGNRRIVNNGGISVERINAGLHRTIVPVDVGALRNAERQGWRGPVTAADRAERNAPSQQFHQASGGNGNHNNNANLNNRQNLGQPNPSYNRSETFNPAPHAPAPEKPGNFNGQPGRDFNNHNANPVNGQHNLNPVANSHPATGTPYVRQQTEQNQIAAANYRPATGTTFNRVTPAPITVPASPTIPLHSAPQGNFQQNRSFNENNVSVPPPQRSFPPAEQHVVITPSVPHNVAPPQNQPHNTDQNGGGPVRNKQNQ